MPNLYDIHCHVLAMKSGKNVSFYTPRRIDAKIALDGQSEINKYITLKDKPKDPNNLNNLKIMKDINMHVYIGTNITRNIDTLEVFEINNGIYITDNVRGLHGLEHFLELPDGTLSDVKSEYEIKVVTIGDVKYAIKHIDSLKIYPEEEA